MAVKIRPVKDRPGVWDVDVCMTLPSGQAYRKTKRLSNLTEKQAGKWGEQHLAQVIVGGAAAVAKPQKSKEVPTVEAFEDDFIKYCRADRQKPSTVKAKQVLLKCHVKPIMGKLRLDQVGPPQLVALKMAMAEGKRKRKPKTVNNALACVGAMLSAAVELGHIKGVAFKLGLLDVVQEEAPYYDFDAFEKLVAGARKAGTAELALVLLGGHAGLREGELRELKWTDLNLQKGKVKIARAIWEDEVNLPKGGRVRELDLSETLRSALTAHHHRRGPYVLCHDDGAQLSVKVIYSLMRAAQRRAEMEDTGLVHILRHTFCSHLAMRGASAKAIQELAGHAQISTTMRYMHLSPAAKRSTVLLLDQVKPEGERGAAS